MSKRELWEPIQMSLQFTFVQVDFRQYPSLGIEPQSDYLCIFPNQRRCFQQSKIITDTLFDAAKLSVTSTTLRSLLEKNVRAGDLAKL